MKSNISVVGRTGSILLDHSVHLALVLYLSPMILMVLAIGLIGICVLRIRKLAILIDWLLRDVFRQIAKG